MKRPPQVLIIGAGPAGTGCALALQACGIEAELVDASAPGASFAAWPLQMRLLTPSFHGNAFGQTDLNALTPQTSPADFLHTQHPDGKSYASYLQALIHHHGLRVTAPCRVTRITPLTKSGFKVASTCGTRHFPWVVWAAGEFSQPDTAGIQGAELGLHNSRVKDWNEVARKGEKLAVIGGYESGVDAAIHLMNAGREVHVFSRGKPWSRDDADPSSCLSPHTRDRLREALLSSAGQVHFHAETDIARLVKTTTGYEVVDRENRVWTCDAPPILCTGFRHALEPIRELWDWRQGLPVFSEEADESTRFPGLFYTGPSLQHRGMTFCFIYKFRARHGVIARAIAQRLGLPWEKPLRLWKERGFMLEDLDCCTGCQCAVTTEAGPEVSPHETAR